MSEDKRPAPPDAIATLGTIIDATAKRDAIHIAVIPLPAAHKLFPGQDVGVVDGQATAKTEAAGIVDPFLKENVVPGERFWLFLYPYTITSLRHDWHHPAFQNTSTIEVQIFLVPRHRVRVGDCRTEHLLITWAISGGDEVP